MTDIYDMASDNEERDRDLAIQIARSKPKNHSFTGRCLYCNDSIAKGLFCNAFCHTDYESEQVIKKHQWR